MNTGLALQAPLGESHRRSVGEALSRFHYALFGENSGAVGALRRLISERFVGTGPAIPLPEAWLCWPITAGGPGLRQPAMLAAAYAESYARRTPPQVPTERTADWQRHANDWSRFYTALLPEVEPAAPEPNKVMETLVNDFSSRGSQLSGGEQQGLSPYWRWVLYTYGPQILERFGTFRFLFTELVPVQLITQRDLADAEAGDVQIG